MRTCSSEEASRRFRSASVASRNTRPRTYLLLWDTTAVGSASIAMRGTRFHDVEENYSLEGLVDNIENVVIVMYLAEELDDASRREAPQDIREEPGETPNIRSLRVLKTGTPHRKKKELVRLHVRLNHIPSYRFTPLLRSAGFSGDVLEWSMWVQQWCKRMSRPRGQDAGTPGEPGDRHGVQRRGRDGHPLLQGPHHPAHHGRLVSALGSDESARPLAKGQYVGIHTGLDRHLRHGPESSSSTATARSTTGSRESSLIATTPSWITYRAGARQAPD